MANKIICVKVSEAKKVLKNSFTSKCTDCQELCWVSPATIVGAPDGSEVLCFDCGIESLASRLKNGKAVQILAPTKGQMREIIKSRSDD